MICSSLSTTIGFTCHPLNDDGSVAMIDTPFTFADGDDIPVFVETIAGQVRFFDDGNVMLHLRGRGVSMNDSRQTRFLRKLAESNGLKLNDMGEMEIWARSTDAPMAFAKYISAMVAVTAWEAEQEGVTTDTSLFLEEVVMCLRAWKLGATISEGEKFIGISGEEYKMDVSVDGRPVLAIGTHHATVSAAAKKLLDINASPSNVQVDVLVVMDDRIEPELARREGLVLDSVSTVLMMSKLEKNARARTSVN